MSLDKTQRFGPFRLDPVAGQLRRGDEPIALRPKTWAVLCYLVENAGRLVTKDELIDEIWGGAAVSDTIAGISVAEIRRALGDSRKQPRFIETVFRRGFRFVGDVAAIADGPPTRRSGPGTKFAASQADLVVVGRDGELAEMRAFFATPDPHARVLLLAGEAGIGKTSLLQTGLAELAATSGGSLAIGEGQCPPEFGQGYPFLPVIVALEDLCRRRPDAIALLEDHAPTWFVRLPFPSTRSKGQAQGEACDDLGLAELIAFARGIGPLVLAFEDLHWADHATLDLISTLACHPAAHQCHVVGTYRPVEAIATRHPVVRARREMLRHGRAREIALAGLEPGAVADYVSDRLSAVRCSAAVATDLHGSSDGNPLFIRVTLDHLIRCRALERSDDGEVIATQRYAEVSQEIPESLRELVQQLCDERKDVEQRVLGALSVVGLEADAAAAAAALGEATADVDAIADELARGSILLDRRGETVWPNGTVSGRYGFGHALYQQVVYDALPPAVRVEAHRRIASALVDAFDGAPAEVAAVLAHHFDRANETKAAIEYHRMAARNASLRFASSDAIAHLHRALELQERTHDAELEARILTQLAEALPAVQGVTGADFPDLFSRARRLRAGDAEAFEGALTLAWLAVANLMRGNDLAAETLAGELARIPSNPSTALLSALVTGAVLYHQGDITGAAEHVTVDNADAVHVPAVGPIDLHVALSTLASVVLWQAGRPATARAQAARALSRAEADAHPFNMLLALQAKAVVDFWCGDLSTAMASARRLQEAAAHQGIDDVKAISLMIQGCIHGATGSEAEAVAAINASLEALQAHGAVMTHSFLLTIAAEALTGLGRLERAAGLLREGRQRIADGDARYYEPEIHRLEGEIELLTNGPNARSTADRCFRRAHLIAEQQGSASLALRSAMSLGRLWRASGTEAEAARIIASALDQIEGDSSRDHQAARAFLAGTDES